MERAHTGSNSTQGIGTRKRGSTISTGCSTMISLMWSSPVPSMDYWLHLMQKLICLMHFIGGTQPAFFEGEKKNNPILPALVVFWPLHVCQVRTGWTSLSFIPLVSLNRTEPVVRDISTYCKLFWRAENGFDGAKTTCVLWCCVERPWT